MPGEGVEAQERSRAPSDIGTASVVKAALRGSLRQPPFRCRNPLDGRPDHAMRSASVAPGQSFRRAAQRVKADQLQIATLGLVTRTRVEGREGCGRVAFWAVMTRWL